MSPTQQRFRADRCPVDEPDFRLVIDFKFPIGIGPRQFEIEHAPRLNLRTMHRQEETARAAAGGFGLVERKIGIGEQFIDAGAVTGSDRDAGAAANTNRVLVDVKALREAIEDRVDDLADNARIAALRNNQDKLVAAEPEHLNLVAVFSCLDEAMSDFDEELIAHRVTERIVDILETVEVKQGYRYRPLRAIAGEQPA